MVFLAGSGEEAVRTREQCTHATPVLVLARPHRGTSLERKRTPLGPYRRPMARVLGGSYGGERFLMREVSLYHAQKKQKRERERGRERERERESKRERARERERERKREREKERGTVISTNTQHGLTPCAHPQLADTFAFGKRSISTKGIRCS